MLAISWESKISQWTCGHVVVSTFVIIVEMLNSSTREKDLSSTSTLLQNYLPSICDRNGLSASRGQKRPRSAFGEQSRRQHWNTTHADDTLHDRVLITSNEGSSKISTDFPLWVSFSYYFQMEWLYAAKVLRITSFIILF